MPNLASSSVFVCVCILSGQHCTGPPIPIRECVYSAKQKEIETRTLTGVKVGMCLAFLFFSAFPLANPYFWRFCAIYQPYFSLSSSFAPSLSHFLPRTPCSLTLFLLLSHQRESGVRWNCGCGCHQCSCQ